MRFSQCATVFAVVFTITIPLLAQTVVVFPPANGTVPNCQQGLVTVLTGADNGGVYFYYGGFFTSNAAAWFGAGPVGCSNFFALQFSPKATGVTLGLHNFGDATTITVGTSTGLVAYSLPKGGDVMITDPGPTLGLNFQSQDPGHTFAITSLTIGHQVTTSTLEMVGTMETPGAVETTYTNPSSQTTVMNVPLGAFFSVGMQKNTSPLSLPTPITTALSASATTVEPPHLPLSTATVMPKVVPLYADRTLLNVDDASGAEVHHFVAIHLGTTVVTLLPVSTSDPAKAITIKVSKPDGLGSSQHAPWDEYYINVAHNSGIPPQYLKGQGRQEGSGSSLRPDNWRYEICQDYETIGGAAGLAFTDARFIPFRLDDAIGNTLHETVLDEIDPRIRFWIKRVDPITGLVDRHIDDTDRQVTAREIWDDNDSVHYRQNWSLQCSGATVAAIHSPGSAVLNFVAQTPTSQSSGIQQVMWEEASQPAFWDGVLVASFTGVREPKYVFDRVDYINVGGGSVQIAANKLVGFWSTKASTFPDRQAYTDRLSNMFRKYNYYWKGVGPDSNTVKVRYGKAVDEWSERERPFSTKVVFQ